MVHNVEFSCSHISFVWLHGLNSLQWWLLTCPDLTNVVWFKNNIDRHEYPKQLQAHPAKKVKYPIPEIPDDSGKKSGTDWVLPKIIGSGRVSGTRQALHLALFDMPNSYRFNILSISIFSEISLSISIFSRTALSISIFSRIALSISIFLEWPYRYWYRYFPNLPIYRLSI